MKKSILTILLASLIGLCCITPSSAEDIVIPKGTFFRVVNIRELSSAMLDEGDTVSFLLSQPFYIRNYKMFPANSIMNGYVSQINEPVEGINASMKIKINKVFTPDKKSYDIQASIFSNGNDYFGGDPTPVKYYKKTPHYIKGFKRGVLQYTPTDYHYMGENFNLKSGAEFLIMLDQDFIFSPEE